MRRDALGEQRAGFRLRQAFSNGRDDDRFRVRRARRFRKRLPSDVPGGRGSEFRLRPIEHQRGRGLPERITCVKVRVSLSPAPQSKV